MSEIEKVLEEMCDHYCKYPYEIYDDNQLGKVCENCPLNKLEAESEET